MDFYPYEPLDNNNAHNKLWEWIREAFKHEPGVAYYRYPIFKKSGDLLKEPDVVLFHRVYGLWVFECKGCTISNIMAIQGHSWQMQNWHKEEETPLLQAEDQMFAIQNKLNSHREVRGKLKFHFRTTLPAIKRKEWQDKGFDQHTEKAVWVYEDLTPTALQKSFSIIAQEYPQALDDKTWDLALKILGGTLPRTEPRQIPTGTPPKSPLRVIHEIESSLKALDEIQQKIAFEVPNGPQRLRGLAGTGKTVLLAKRIAKLHIKYPNWTIGFVFFTRSLYDQILELITLYCQELGDRDPNWLNIKVLHSWGGRSQDGFYYDLAKRMNITPLRVDHVTQQIGRTSPSKGFEYICLSLVKDCLISGSYSSEDISQIKEVTSLKNDEILTSSDVIQKAYIESEIKNLQLVPQLYDALLIDEGQDLPPIFYKLLLSSLKEPKRLYWAYDEAQSIGSLTIPTAAEMFGRDAEGKPRVDVSGSYTGGIQKTHRMHRCYRTPRLLLMTAHALNMGLLRKGGPLQGVTTIENWKALGYTITEGDFSNASVSQQRTVTITREPSASPHPVDQESFQQKDALGDILIYKTFESETQEQKWITQQVVQDIDLGFKPEDIFITALSGDYEKDYFQNLKSSLEQSGIQGYIAGVDGDQNIFRIAGKVTISNIFRAKGNEAWKVYACRFHYATRPLNWKQETELQKRNEAFVALTRAKVWCVVTGIEDELFDEFAKTLPIIPFLKFPAFNKASLGRVTDDVDFEQQS